MIDRDLIDTQIKAILGDPILPSLTKDTGAIDSAIKLANIKYWKSFPHTFIETGNYSFNATSEVRVLIDTIKDSCFNYSGITDQDVKDSLYYIGPIRNEVYNQNELYNNQGLDSYLLGFPFKQQISPNNYSKFLLNKTTLGIVQGAIEIRTDWVSKSLVYIFPYAMLKYVVYHAFGFKETHSLDMIATDKTHIFLKMVLCEFLDILINSRSSIRLQGDYEVNVDYLIDLKKKSEEELSKVLSDSSIYPILVS